MVTDKNNQRGLLYGCQRGDFMVVAILLAFIHEGKPHFRGALGYADCYGARGIWYSRMY